MPIRLQLPDGRLIEIASNSALIGRDPNVQVPLVGMKGIEPLHARLRHMAGRWMIESQGEWLLQVGAAPPARMGWLKPGDEVLLTPEGPKITFEPAPAAAEAPSSSLSAARPASTEIPSQERKPTLLSREVADSPSERRSAPALLLVAAGFSIALVLAIFFWPRDDAPVVVNNFNPPTRTVQPPVLPPALDPLQKLPGKAQVGLWPLEDPANPQVEDPRKEAPVVPDPVGNAPPGKAPLEPADPDKPDEAPPAAPDRDPPGEVRIFSGHGHYVSFVAFLPGDKQLLSASYDKTLRIWSMEDGREVHRFPGHASAVTAVALTSDGRRAVSGDLNGALKLWNLETRLEGRSFEGSPSSLASLSFSPDGKRLVSGHLGAVHLWDAATGKRLETLIEKPGFLGALFGPGDEDVLLYSEDGKLQRFNLADHKPLEAREHPGSLGGVALSRDGQQLATACRDAFVRLSAMDAWDSVRELDQKAAVNSVAFSPDGKRLVSGGQDGAVIVWSAGTGKPLVRFEGHTAAVRRVAFSSDGRLVASASSDNTVRVWRVPWEDPGSLLVFSGRRAIPQEDPTLVAKTPAKRDPDDPFGPLVPRRPDPTLEPKQEPKEPVKLVPPAGALEIPDQATQAAALKRIKDLFKEEYAQRKPEGKKLLAAKLYEQGADPVNQPESRYVLLREARDLASEAADAETAWRAIDEMARWYLIPVTEMKLAALSAAVPQARTAEEASSLATMCLALMDRSVAIDDYETATAVIALAVTAGRKSQLVDMVNRAQAKGDDVREIKREYLRVKPALDAISLQAADGPAAGPEALLAAGRFIACYKNDWPRGLRLLTRASDERIAKLAAADLAEPTEVAEQIQLGDGWWDLAEASRGLAKQRLHARAGRWYELALPSAGGLDKVRLEKRLAQLAPPVEKVERPKLPVKGE